VIQNLFKDEISQKMKETGLRASDKGWLQQYQWAVNEVVESKCGEEDGLEKYGEMAKTWNEVGVPEELQRR
jgi:hypothetical protein